MTDDDFETICVRTNVQTDDGEVLAQLRRSLELYEPELRSIYENGGIIEAARWLHEMRVRAEEVGYLTAFLACLLFLWDDEKVRVKEGYYSKIEYKRIIDGVESGKVPDTVWLYRLGLNQVERLGIEDQIRDIIKEQKETYHFTNSSIAHAVGMDETSLSRFLNRDQGLDIRSLDLIVHHFAIVLIPWAGIKNVRYPDQAAGKRKGRNDKGKKRKHS